MWCNTAQGSGVRDQWSLQSPDLTTMSPRQSTQGCGATAQGSSHARVREDCTVFQLPVGMRRFGIQGRSATPALRPCVRGQPVRAEVWLSPHAGTLRGGVGGGGPPLTRSAAFALRIRSAYEGLEAQCNAMNRHGITRMSPRQSTQGCGATSAGVATPESAKAARFSSCQ
jgi:hypothetical protein